MKKIKTLAITSEELALTREELALRAAVKVFGIVFFSFATSFGALVRIPLPFTPVPLTLQTYFVLLSGLALGASAGALSQGIYLLFGLFGMPLFAGATTGPAILYAPTTGYLLGFIMASSLAGFATRDDVTTIKRIVFLIFATLLILLTGATFLSLNTHVSFLDAIRTGFLPFLIGDLIKLTAALGTWHYSRKALKHILK